MADASALATFLRARRNHLNPVDVGLVDGGRRRVTGLRREEVAMLAGISAEYYLRLEQGRERQPSDQVLESLANALQLDDDAIEYMRNLRHPTPRRRRRTTVERLDPGLRTLIESWAVTPAYVQDRRMTILAANPMAKIVMPCFTPGSNQLKSLFLDPEIRALVGNWDAVTAVLVSWLRFTVSQTGSDTEIEALIGGLSIASHRFSSLWARHEVKQKTSGPLVIDHPQVGPMDLRYRSFVIPGTSQALVTYYAEPGSASDEGLRLLSGLTTSPATLDWDCTRPRLPR